MLLSPCLHFSPLLAGDLLIIMAQVIVAIQMVLEEKFVYKHDVHPLRAVGTEGLLQHQPRWLSTLGCPILQTQPGEGCFVRGGDCRLQSGCCCGGLGPTGKVGLAGGRALGIGSPKWCLEPS